jgi:hypothetical protein
MKTAVALLFALALAGCDQNKKADNSATRYAESLKEDTFKAKDAAAKANAAIASQDQRMQEAQDQNK